MPLSKRQQAILAILQKKEGGAATREILVQLQQSFDAVSRITVIRDLDTLLDAGLIRRTGKGRAVRYEESLSNTSLRSINPDAYFSIDDTERILRHATYHAHSLDAFGRVFTRIERASIITLNTDYRKRMRALPAGIVRKEMERFTAEFSWKSSQIEGNTYSLLDTEILLKDRREAEGHSRLEAQMILNHKSALNFIVAHPMDYAPLTVRRIEQLHEIIVRDLHVSRGIRSFPVGILGTSYRPMRIRSQLREALEDTVKRINAESWPPAQALMALLMIAYIQPFEDGNKRTARLLGNALLIAGHFCPLSFRSIDEKEYKKAVILFYEQHNIRYFKQLFIEQFSYAAKNYFL